jgi:HK97 family phage prohead protease
MEIATGFLLMQIERKFIDLKDMKMSEEGPGTIEGYRSVFGEVDEGGDIVLKGAFADSMDEYISSGFSAHSHDWKFTEAVGYPVEAREDDYGWFVKSEFHTTETAQDARKIASERKKAGKKVGFSFAYIPLEYEYIDAKDFKEKLPLYVKADRLDFNLNKAQKFNRIRLLKKVEAPEDSLVLAGMNKLATATAVKSATGPAADGKGMLAEEMAQTTPSTWEVESALRRVVRKIAETAKDSDVTGVVMDWKAKVAEAFNEYPPTMIPLVTAQIEEFLNSSDDEFYLKGQPVSDSFESFDDVVSALAKHTSNMQRNHENRVKEGRMLSSSNRAKVQSCMDKIMELHTELSNLMEMSEPKPKEKSIDVAALRTQSLRMQSLAIRALA